MIRSKNKYEEAIEMDRGAEDLDSHLSLPDGSELCIR
jgi:hypothetical protein